MRRRLTILAALIALGGALSALAEDAGPAHDPIGDLISSALTQVAQAPTSVMMKTTLYHSGIRGVGNFDSLGCRVVAMRTAAIGILPRRTLVFIKETVGLPMPDGRAHDGYWYGSDTGGAIKGARIDLFTGEGSASMQALAPFNQRILTVQPVKKFEGCPQG